MQDRMQRDAQVALVGRLGHPLAPTQPEQVARIELVRTIDQALAGADAQAIRKPVRSARSRPVRGPRFHGSTRRLEPDHRIGPARLPGHHAQPIQPRRKR